MDNRTLRILEFDKIINILTSYAESDLGRSKCKTLLPCCDLDEITRNLGLTSDAVNFINRRGMPPLTNVKDISPSIKRIEIGGILNFAELLEIRDILNCASRLKNYSATMEQFDKGNINTIETMISSLYTNKRLEERIDQCILNEEEMADDASPKLYSIRRQIRDLKSSIKDTLNSILHSSSMQKYMQDSLVTVRDGRYVIPVKSEYKQHVKGLVHDASSSGQTLFIEPMAVVETNNKIKELKIKEQNEIERILYELSQEVYEVKDYIMSDVDIIAELDFNFSKAKFAIDFRCTCPVLNSLHNIYIKKGRHPLIDKNEVVPIDFWIGDGFSSLIVTGPNTGGKTVTLKTVGLFTLMVQAGLHIPAESGSQMSVFGEVYADIGDEQSIEQSLSTFSSHMKNIVGILNNAGENSLVLLDELGAGTDPTEGAALAMAILESLYIKGATCVATTHYSELKVFAMTREGFENASCEFDVETLRPTYRLLIGTPGKSNAFAISKRLGLENVIINRAKEFLTSEEIKFEDILTDIERNKAKAEQDREVAKKLKEEISLLKAEVESERRKLDTKREQYIKQAKMEALNIVSKAKEEAEEILSEIRKIAQEESKRSNLKKAESLKVDIASKANELEGELSENPLSSRKEDSQHGFDIKDGKPIIDEGMKVKIISLKQNGTVVRKPDKDGNVLVQVGILKMNIHISNLKLLKEEQDVNIAPSKRRASGNIKAMNIPLELDVRGFTIDDAIPVIDKYLDDALLANLKQVRIIHGKGTGALRAGIHSYLKRNKSVKSFRLGTIGEGDMGVTVITLVT